MRTVSRYPRGAWRPLGPQTEPRMDRVDVVCVHTMVGFLATTEDMFRRGGYSGTESHFGIGGKWGPDGRGGLDGVVWQWQDLDRQADANLDGAHRVISIETADNAPRAAADILPWTPKQVASLVDLIVWLCETFDVPPALVPDSRPGRRGLAFHRQGIDPWRVTGGERWSSARGKECPGPVRIQQLTVEVIPAVRAKVLRPAVAGQPDAVPDGRPKPATLEGGDDMFIAHTAGKADKRQFLIAPPVKMLLPNGDVADELRDAGVRDVGDMSGETLSLFATVDTPSAAELFKVVPGQVADLHASRPAGA